MEDIFKGRGIELKLFEDSDFLKIKETLERIGISSKAEKKLWPSCHILHKQGRYAILHYKELLILDGGYNSLEPSDIHRRDNIALLLEEWGLLKISNNDISFTKNIPLKILSYKEKNEWDIVFKYSIGSKK